MRNEFDYLNDVKMDFSIYDAESVSEKELRHMKKNKKHTKKLIIAAACAATLIIGVTAVGSGAAGFVIKSLTTGFNTYLQTDPDEAVELDEKLQGKLFDKNGVPYTHMTRADFENIYDADGNKLSKEDFADIFAEAYGTSVEISENGKLYFSDDTGISSTAEYASIDEAKENSSFDIKLPDSLPDGYELESIYTYKNNEGKPSGDYVTLTYVNSDGDGITIFERTLNDETRFTSSTDAKIEKITLNGHKAVMEGTYGIDWETEDNVSVTVHADNLKKNELISFAAGIE